MELRRMDRDELTALYEGEMVHDFPDDERRPLRAMLRLMDRDRYDPMLAVEDGAPMGYALLWLPEHQEGAALLEYLGVLRGKRNGGAGSRILAALGEHYSQLFGEAEAPTSGDPEEDDLRRRRIGFYQRNGFRVLEYECAMFGVHFKCLYRGPETDDQKVLALHRGTYTSYFSPPHMERYIQIPLAPGEAIHPAPRWLEEDDEGAIFP